MSALTRRVYGIPNHLYDSEIHEKARDIWAGGDVLLISEPRNGKKIHGPVALGLPEKIVTAQDPPARKTGLFGSVYGAVLDDEPVTFLPVNETYTLRWLWCPRSRTETPVYVAERLICPPS